MKSYIVSLVPILWLATLALAEPPVGDGYPSARSSHDHLDHHHHHNDHQHEDHHNDSTQDTTPASVRSTGGYSYPAPSGRTLSGRGSTRSFPPATVRVSFTQRYQSAGSDRRQPTPVPVSARTLSTQYGMPDSRSTPNQEYGTPLSTASNVSFGNLLTRSPQTSVSTRSHSAETSPQFNNPLTRSQETSGHKSFGARTAPSDKYGVPSRSEQASSRSDSEVVDLVSQTYGAPSQRISDTYGPPNARSLSQEYGTPETRRNGMDGEETSFGSDSSRSFPSPTYLPSSRSAPSNQYGPPEQRDSSQQGYDYSDKARARALEELSKQEPASYDFGYQIEDQESGSDFGHSETREENRAEGSYFVVLPDGTKQTVEYEADEAGFRPRISVQPAGGYNGNAQDITRSAQGPY